MQKNENNEAEINAIKTYFFDTYSPAQSFDKDVLIMSTFEIYHALRRTYPSKGFKAYMVASWLLEGGFKVIDMGQMKFEWMLKNASPAPP